MRATDCFPNSGDFSDFGPLSSYYLFAGSPFHRHKYVFFYFVRLKNLYIRYHQSWHLQSSIVFILLFSS